ncbi:MAG: hypothetical protein K0R08_739 [Solimicrobium sp.]|jgi:translation initiation factor IF-1|nr:hypothetical protein [Solimicrobium sp.]
MKSRINKNIKIGEGDRVAVLGVAPLEVAISLSRGRGWQ